MKENGNKDCIAKSRRNFECNTKRDAIEEDVPCHCERTKCASDICRMIMVVAVGMMVGVVVIATFPIISTIAI